MANTIDPEVVSAALRLQNITVRVPFRCEFIARNSEKCDPTMFAEPLLNSLVRPQ